jgi:hypothetical protein
MEDRLYMSAHLMGSSASGWRSALSACTWAGGRRRIWAKEWASEKSKPERGSRYFATKPERSQYLGAG